MDLTPQKQIHLKANRWILCRGHCLFLWTANCQVISTHKPETKFLPINGEANCESQKGFAALVRDTSSHFSLFLSKRSPLPFQIARPEPKVWFQGQKASLAQQLFILGFHIQYLHVSSLQLPLIYIPRWFCNPLAHLISCKSPSRPAASPSAMAACIAGMSLLPATHPNWTCTPGLEGNSN